MTLERLSASLADRYRLERRLDHGGMATVQAVPAPRTYATFAEVAA